jgi:outer membrane protein OmpA-like peptidoglycan-associated protein
MNKKLLSIVAVLLYVETASAQVNLLLNGGFEDINTCTEYNAECGVEGWFYLKEVKVQMIPNDINTGLLGNNSPGISYTWNGYTGFTPVIGALLPCHLQKGKQYIFRGMLIAKLNATLLLMPGICVGERFYVTQRPFSKNLHPDSIPVIAPVPNSNFIQFEYRFIANGEERYLTFGSYIQEDTTLAKKKITGMQTVSVVLDNFSLVPADEKETTCTDFNLNKKKIYQYNFRHKEMDYSLYGKGELPISFNSPDSNLVTRAVEPPALLPVPDTLKLGDVLFDFNKAGLKPGAVKILEIFFLKQPGNMVLDSIYIEGHTDSIGGDDRNLSLSMERCESVRQWLLSKTLLTENRVQVHPFGRSKPVASNRTPEGRALNRRVEIIIFNKREQ